MALLGSKSASVGCGCRESEQGSSTSDMQASPSLNGVAAAQQTRYRIASVGQDCQLLLWDFVEEEDDYLDMGDASTSR